MVLLRQRKLARVENLLHRARYIADLGSGMQRVERNSREALAEMTRIGLLSHPSPADLELVAEAALLLGRVLRLRGAHLEARNWLRRSSEILDSQLRVRVAARTADRLAECSNHLSLVELNLADMAARRKSTIAYAGLTSALRWQQTVVQGGLPLPDQDNQFLEMVQRVADGILRMDGPVKVKAYLDQMGFDAVARNRPDHNRALRFMYTAHIATKLGDADASWAALDRIRSLPIIAESRFLNLLFIEKMADLHFLVGETAHSERLLAEAALLRQLEQISERGRAD